MTLARRRAIEELLEVLGFEMAVPSETVRHYLVKPTGLRLANRSPTGDESWVEGRDYLVWDSFREVEMRPEETRGCLWGFVAMAEASPSQILRFVRKWGLLYAPEDDDYLHPEGWIELRFWRDQANVARSLLVVLAQTEAGETASDATLRWLAERDWERDPEFLASGELEFQKVGPRGAEGDAERHPAGLVQAATQDVRRRLWEEIRRSGGSILHQARVVARVLNEWSSPRSAELVWDERGRRVEMVAAGVREIVASHLYSLFVSGQIDVLTCSVCGRPYQFDTEERERRPRRGVKRFCSDACRLQARRESNRQSWHKNRDKWRPRQGGAASETKDDHGTTS